MTTAIVILVGLALLQLWANVVLFCLLRIAWSELKDRTQTLTPIDTDVWDEIKRKDTEE